MDIQPSTERIPEFTLGDRLRKARESMGLDRDQFAALGEPGDFSYKQIGNYELGITIPKRFVLRELARMARVPLSWLLTGEVPTNGGPDGGLPASVTKLPGLDSNQEPIGDITSAKSSTFRTREISESDYSKAA